MPPIVLTILGFVNAAMQYAPELKEIYANARQLFQMWFSGGIITAEQQKQLMDWANEHEAATLAGDVPPELQVEPDPE